MPRTKVSSPMHYDYEAAIEARSKELCSYNDCVVNGDINFENGLLQILNVRTVHDLLYILGCNQLDECTMCFT